MKSARHLRALCLVSVCWALATLAFGRQADSQEPPKQAGSEVPAPKRTKTVAPAYPPGAQAQGLRGIVILELVINEEGKVESVDVVRSVPPFDDAAIAAVRQWQYEVTRLDGRPVRVRLTVPISFALRLPDVKRQEGIPELRQGAAPVYPQGAEGDANVVAQVTLDAEGGVAEADVRSGGSPWAEALLQALRSWHFNVEQGRGILSFRVEAAFRPAGPGQPARVNLELSGVQESLSGPVHPHLAGDPLPAVAQAPPPSPAEPAPAPHPSHPAATEPQPNVPGTPAPASAPQAEPPGAPVQAPEPPPETSAPRLPAPPPVEIISAPAPAPARLAPGVSALVNVVLGPGVPDLVRGRRPAPPPMARMAGATGAVVVRLSVDAGGQTSVTSSEGPDLLKPAAEDAVRTWSFRRTTTERLHMTATFSYANDSATVLVNLEP